MPKLVLGPLLRYVGETQATVWVETDAAAQVEVPVSPGGVRGREALEHEVDGVVDERRLGLREVGETLDGERDGVAEAVEF